jgi:tetratricopeptide (TPR) repeat protein
LDSQELQRGLDLHRRGDLAGAEAIYRRLALAHPQHFGAAQMLGVLLLQSNRPAEAAQELARACALRPDSAEALGQWGDALRAQGLLDAALQAYDRKLALQPGDAETLYRRGLVLHAQRHYAQAAASHEQALRTRPDDPRILYSSANALVEVGRFDEALRRFDHCLRVKPDFQGAYRNRGILKLLTGDLAGGWPDYEHRRPKPSEREITPELAPDWEGQDPRGKSILVSDATGLGDAIQFIRYLPMLVERGARVSFLGNPRLFRLFTPLAGKMRFLATLPENERFDYHCKLLSLPGLFDTRMDSIPCPVPYLFAEPERIAKWSERIGKQGFRIGIVWKGNPSRTIDGGRSVPLSCFAPLARVPGVRLISLQKRYGLEQLQQLPEGMVVESPGEDLDESEDAFLDSAALMESLDLVVSSDTSTIHVAGALGRPAFLALKFVPEWRWFLGRSDTAWYPSVRLFRQPVLDDWDSAFEAMVPAIAAMRAQS